MYFDDVFVPPEVWLVRKDGTFYSRVFQIESLDVTYSVEEPSTLHLTAMGTQVLDLLQPCDGEYLLAVTIRGYTKIFFPSECHQIIEPGLHKRVDVTAVCGLAMIKSIFLGDQNPARYEGSLRGFFNSDMMTSARTFSPMASVLDTTEFRGSDPYIVGAFYRHTFGQFFDDSVAPKGMRLISDHGVVKASAIRTSVLSYKGGDAVWPKPVIFDAGQRDVLGVTPALLFDVGHIAELDVVNFPTQATTLVAERDGYFYKGWNNNDLSQSMWVSRTETVNLPDLGEPSNEWYQNHMKGLLTLRQPRVEYRVKISDSAPIRFGDPTRQAVLDPNNREKEAMTWVREGDQIEITFGSGTRVRKEITAVKVAWSGDDYAEEFVLSDFSSRPRNAGFMDAEESTKLADLMRRS